jgi:chromosome segregation protein
MYLSELKIIGFKSFPNKTDLKFSHGITCIIGPNGCGKSNIVDAIRWVIGEQRSGALRSDKMTDVIFNGTKKKKPLSYAEVSLTIINDRNVLPSEYREVTLSRRLFRDSSSEYMINGTQCRLKDIQNLFMDTGMGSDAYSVIELKMVEQILSTNHSERRLLFEEAAGIKKYKQSRKSAEKKLLDTNQDLLRVNDILEEVENKVTKLSKQVDKARKYKEFKDRLYTLELESAACNYKNILADIKPLEERLGTIKSSHQDRANQISLDESLIESYKKQLLDTETELSEQRQRLFNHDEKIRLIREQELISSEKAKNNEDLVERLKEEIESLANRKETADEIIGKKRSELEALQRDADGFEDKFQLVEEEYLEYLETENGQNIKIQQVRKESEVLKNKINKLEHEIKYSKQQVLSIEDSLENIEDSQKNELDLLEENIKNVKTTIEEKKNISNTASEKLEFVNIKIENYQAEIQAVDIKKREKEKDYLQLESKRNLLEESLLSGDLFPESTKEFLAQVEFFPSFLGVFSELIRIKDATDPKLEKALENYAAFPILNAPDTGELEQLIELNLKLSVFIIPNSDFICVQNNISQYLESDLLSENEINYLFANSALLDSFEQFSNDTNEVSNLISERLEYSFIDRILQLKGENKSGIKLLSIQKDIESFDQQLGKLEEEINTFEEQAADIEKTLNEEIIQTDKLKAQIAANQKELTELQIKDKMYEVEKNHLLNAIKDNQQRKEQLSKEKNEIEVFLKKNIPIYEEDIEEESNIDKKLNEYLTDLEEIKRKVYNARDRVNELKIEKNQIENKQESLKELLKREYYFLKDSDKLIEDKKSEIERIKNQKNSISTESEERKTIINKLIETREEILADKSQVEDKYVKIKDNIIDIEQAIKRQRKDREEYQEKLRSIELKLNELNVKATSIAERIYNEHQIDIHNVRIESDFELLKAERDIFLLKGRITALGEVNSLAIEEYEKEKERYDFLKKQYDDLIKAEDLLSSTIKEINNTAKEQFQIVFDQIRKNFQLVFQQFFQRGEGDLQLIEHEDPLEGKIEIKVRPKGRTLQTLTLMSGGEKTLTAISLLFAIYLVKPSPFCILDEVDAPLDDINITRFSQAIRSFTDKTQFIIITHNKRTMEAADFMYGVTQEEEGISKIVSVKFD